MDRRHFCQTLTAVAGGLALGAQAAVDPVYAAFQAQRDSQPWTLGYAGLQHDVPPLRMALRGRLPRGLEGAFFRNGPARHEIGSHRYHHSFDGDGMVQKYQIANGQVIHQGRFVRTEKFIAESEAGRPLRATFGTPVPGGVSSSTDAINVANTSVVHHGGELLALWEGGSAIRLDAGTLDTLGTKTWSPEYRGMPFSAHPKVEPDGTMWNFGITSFRGLLTVYRIKASGELAQAVSMPVPHIAMVHDFAVTARHLVFLLPPLVLDVDRLRAGQTFLDSHVWKPELGMRVLVLPKDQLDAPQWFELPAGFVFHIGNAWEDPRTGSIHLDHVHSPSAWHASEGIRQLMRGEYAPREYASVALVRLDLRSGRASQVVLSNAVEFPRVDPRVVGRRHTQLYLAARHDLGVRPGFNAVMRLDVNSGRVDRHSFGDHVMVEEHVFVPRRAGSGPESEGWLVGSALDLKTRQTLFTVFDAARLSDGPIAEARMPRAMPLGLHGVFVAA